jgi:hypothetical protein
LDLKPAKTKAKRHSVRKHSLTLAVVLLAVAGFLSGPILLLPAVISSQWFEKQLENRLTHKLQRPVQIDSLAWQWRQPIRIKGVRLEDDPAFSNLPLLQIDTIQLTIGLKKWAPKCLDINFQMNGMHLRFIRNKNDQTNLARLLAQVTEKPAQKTIQKNSKAKAFKLPLEVSANIHMERLFFAAIDQLHGTRLAFNKGALHFSAPGLRSKPMRLEISAIPTLNGHFISPVSATLLLRNFFDSGGRLNVENGYIELNALGPGIRLQVASNPDLKESKMNLNADLAKMTTAIGVFLPHQLLSANAAGIIDVSTTISGDPFEHIAFDGTLKGSKLAFSGGPLAKNILGPAQCNITGAGTLDVPMGRLNVATGSIRLFEHTRIDLRGQLSGLWEREKKADVHVKPLVLDLKELFHHFSFYLPETVSFDSGGPRPVLQVQDLHFAGNLFSGFNDIAIADLLLQIPALTIASGQSTFRAASLELSLARIKARLKSWILETIAASAALKARQLYFGHPTQIQMHDVDLSRFDFEIGKSQKTTSNSIDLNAALNMASLIAGSPNTIHLKKIEISDLKLIADKMDRFLSLPGQLDAAAVLKVNDLHATGKKQFRMRQLAIPSLRILAHDIRPSISAPLGLTARARLGETVSIGEMDIPALALIKNIFHTSDAACLLTEGAKVEAEIENLEIFTPKMTLMKGQSKFFSSDVRLDARAANIEIAPSDPLKSSIDGLQLAMAIGKTLALDMRATAGQAPEVISNTRGTLTIDLAHLPEIILDRLPEKTDLHGETQLEWDFAGKLSEHGAMKQMILSPNFTIKKNLAFIDRFNVFLNIENAALDLPLTGDNRLAIQRISTGQPFSYRFDQTDGQGTLEGELVCGAIDNIPGLKPFKQPLNLNLSFSGRHDDIQSFEVAQVLLINPGGIKENWELSVYGLDRILQKGVGKPSSHWLNLAGGRSETTLTIEDLSILALLDNLSELSGKLTVSSQFKLMPRTFIEAKNQVHASSIDFNWQESASVKNLNADIFVHKNYQLIQEGQPENLGRQKSPYLSSTVLQRDAVSALGLEAGRNLLDTFTESSQKRLNASHSFWADAVKLNFSSVPLEFQHFAGDIDFAYDAPNLDFFQANILGGTVRGAVSVVKKKDRFFIVAHLAFTGVDTGRLVSQDPRVLKADDTELSGRMRLSFPLVPRLAPFLQQLAGEIYFSQIGSRAIERFLYALDPYESSEVIVSQRSVLKTGTPRWMTIAIENGSLSLNGAVMIKGVDVAIPSLKRFNMAALPGLTRYSRHLAVLGSVIRALTLFSTDKLILKENGKIEIGGGSDEI